MNGIPLILSLSAFLIPGTLVLLYHRRMAEEAGLLEKLGWSFMSGMGMLSLQMFFYSLGGAHLKIFSIVFPWIACAVFLLFIPSMRARIREWFRPAVCNQKGDRLLFHFPAFRSSLSPFLFMKLILIAQILYVFVYALSTTLQGWDAWAIWFLKARAFFLQGLVSPDFLKDTSFDHQDYPLLLPLCVSWIFAALGQADDLLAKALFPVQFLSLLGIFYGLASRLSSRKNALFFTSLLSMVPLLVMHAGGFSGLAKFSDLYASNFVGYADLTLSIFVLAGAGHLAWSLAAEDPRLLGWAGFYLGMAAWTKNEGVAACAVALFLAVIFWFPKRREAVRWVLTMAGVMLAIQLPWIFYKNYLGLENEYLVVFGWNEILQGFRRLPLMFRYLAENLFFKPGIYNFLWWAYLLGPCLDRVRLRSRPVLLLHLFVLLQIGAYFFIYMISPREIEWQLRTSLDRLLLHVAPTALLVTALHIHGFAEEKRGQATF